MSKYTIGHKIKTGIMVAVALAAWLGSLVMVIYGWMQILRRPIGPVDSYIGVVVFIVFVGKAIFIFGTVRLYLDIRNLVTRASLVTQMEDQIKELNFQLADAKERYYAIAAELEYFSHHAGCTYHEECIYQNKVSHRCLYYPKNNSKEVSHNEHAEQ